MKDKQKSLEVSRNDAVDLLTSLGFVDIRKADEETLVRRLGKLKRYLESYEGTLTSEKQELADTILKAGSITITGSDTPKGKAGKGKSKGPKPTKASRAKKSESKPKKANKKQPGVIATIQALITAKPMTKDSILKALVKKFPDRPAEGMAKTITAQLPKRMAKEKGIKITKDEKGRYHAK